MTPTGAQLAKDPVAARALLAQACQQTTREFKAQAIILGGAGLAGMAAAIQSQVDVPVIDSVLTGTRQALQLASLKSSGGSELIIPNQGLNLCHVFASRLLASLL